MFIATHIVGARNVTVDYTLTHQVAHLNFHCAGDESRLIECSATTFNSCPSNSMLAAAGVICGGM